MTLSISIGLWAYLYASKLVQSEEIFSFMPNVTEYLISFGKNRALQPVPNPNYLQNAVRKWLYKCGTCHAGIVALLVFSVKCRLGLVTIEEVFCCTVAAMFVTELLTEIKDRI